MVTPEQRIQEMLFDIKTERQRVINLPPSYEIVQRHCGEYVARLNEKIETLQIVLDCF